MQHVTFMDEAGRIAALRRYEVLDTEPEAPFDKITSLVKKLFDVPVAMVSLIDTDRQWMKSVQGSNVCEVPRGFAFCSHTIQAAEPLVVADLSEDPRFMANPLVAGEPFVRSYAGVPLRTPDGYNIGALCVIDMVPRRFDPAKVEILKSFASLVVDELELRRIAHNDHLTGAMTRRAFLAEADKAIAVFSHRRTPGALVLLDLDRFKMVNDTYGHPTGDLVLRHIAQRCQDMLRAGERFGRVGGEEFGILMPDVSEEAARQGAERYRESLADMVIDNDPPLRVTASFGIASLTAQFATSESWMAAADVGLYLAKTGGRNRCCLSPPQPHSVAA